MAGSGEMVLTWQVLQLEPGPLASVYASNSGWLQDF